MTISRSFASDNNAGAHAEVLAAITRSNDGHARGYGGDAYTHHVIERFRRIFGDDADVHFVFNGTGANVVALGTLLRSHQAIICTRNAHLFMDECGAVENFTGSQLITVDTPDGKLTPALVEREVWRMGDQHHTQPRVVSISQATELGTLYSLDELRALRACTTRHGLLLHVDGARFANAAAALGVSLRELSAGCGIDALSFGGTKNGMLFGEAVIFFGNLAEAQAAPFVRKQAMQLSSKMRFVAAQFDAMLTDDLWLRSARHANAMAELLAKKLAHIPQIQIAHKVQSNAVFAKVPPHAIEAIRERFFFYTWDAAQSVVRWMAAFDTTEHDIDEFVQTIREAVSAG